MKQSNAGDKPGNQESAWALPLRILLITFVVTLSLSGIQLLMLRGASFLGIQAQGVSFHMIRLYAWVGLKEFFSLASLSSLWILVAVSLTLLNLRCKGAAGRLVRLPASFLPLAAWLTETFSCLVTYPALFEEYLGQKSLYALYRLSYLVNPVYLHYLAITFFALALVRPFSLLRIKTGPSLIAAASLSLCLAGLSRGTFQQVFNTGTPYMGEKPNILLLAVDSLRYDVSDAPAITPHLNLLKSDRHTLVFRDHHIGVPRTFPSWVELIQGRYAARTGIRHMFPAMAQRRRPMKGLVSSLQEAGYRTSVVSDFAGDIFPRFQGGFGNVNAPELSIPTLVRMGVDQAFPLFLPLLLRWPGSLWFPDLLESPNFADAESLKEKILMEAGAEDEQPFFLTGFFSTAHFPYAAPWPWNLKFTSEDYQGPFYFQKNPDLGDGNSPVTEKDIEQIRGLYKGAVSATDEAIGGILNWLKKKGIYENTMIIITADHGEDLYEDGVVQGHGDHLQGNHVTRVPLLIKLPSSLKAVGGGITGLTRSVDLMPTVLGLLRIPAPAADGTDLSPWITDRQRPGFPQLTAYSETGLWFSRGGSQHFQKERLDYPGISGLLNFDPGNSGDIILNPQFEHVIITAKHRSLIRGDYKLIYIPTHDGPLFRLYNRRSDPMNQNDLSNSQREILKNLKAEFFRLVQEIEGDHQLIEDFVVES